MLTPIIMKIYCRGRCHTDPCLQNARMTIVEDAVPYIKTICVKDRSKKRDECANLITYNPDDILRDPDINLVVELIDSARDAFSIVKKAMLMGKSVVSGNKAMLAHHLPELVQLQEKTGVALLYDASACGSIPVIRNLEEYYDNDLLVSIRGILNGSTNFILSRMFIHSESYSDALCQAQSLGFAESNPDFDVMGFDALYKLIILALHSFGTFIQPEQAFCYGIQNLTNFDIGYAREKGKKIKLVAHLRKFSESCFTLFVIPTLVAPDDYIFNVENEFNGVVIEGQYYDKQFMFGKGAGGFPTASAVLSDITARLHGYRYEYKKFYFSSPPSYTTDVVLSLYIRYSRESDLNVFDILEVQERYNGPEYCWVVARVKLSSLLKIKELLPKRNLFTIFTGEYSGGILS